MTNEGLLNIDHCSLIIAHGLFAFHLFASLFATAQRQHHIDVDVGARDDVDGYHFAHLFCDAWGEHHVVAFQGTPCWQVPGVE